MSPAKKEAIALELFYGGLLLAVMIVGVAGIMFVAKGTIEDKLPSMAAIAGMALLVIIIEYCSMRGSMQSRKRSLMNKRAHHSNAHYLLWRRNQRLENEQKRMEWQALSS